MKTYYLVTGAYGQWGVPFETEYDAYEELFQYMKRLGDYDLTETFDKDSFLLSKLDPLEYFAIIPWNLDDETEFPSVDINQGESETIGFTLVTEDEDVAYGLFANYEDGVSYYEKYKETFEIPEFKEEIDPLEIISKFK